MIRNWLRSRRRRTLQGAPFPQAWEEILNRNVRHVELLDHAERTDLQDFLQVFLAEKSWEGCGGLELDDEIRVTIAGLAGLLVLGRAHEYYRNVRSILVYPSTVLTPERSGGVFERPTGPVATGVPILGEAQLRGPIILVWDAVLHHARHPGEGHNVVYHEFAHKLDMLDGAADGTPPLESRDEMRRWVAVCEREFEELRAQTARGKPSFLDAYGATNEAEFFAVATEYFFDRPGEMRKKEGELYGLLKDFYQQDPAEREERARRGH